jgi:hypothetical protein
MIDAGKDIAAIQDILVGDMPRNQTATATMAMIEQGLKVFTAIYKRVYRSLQQEYRLIFEINKRQIDAPRYVALFDKPIEIVQADYMGDLDILPASDPNMVTDMQRMSKASFVLEEGKSGNAHVDLFQATKRAFDAARIDNVDEVLVQPSGPSPVEQVTLEGAIAELAEVRAKVDKLRAEADKIAADAAVTKAQLMLPLGVPIPVSQPQFMPHDLAAMPEEQSAPQQMIGESMDAGLMPGMDGGQMPAGPPMTDEGQSFQLDQGLPPELFDTIAAERMAASDGMPGEFPA